jgi:hypothetical protein
MVPGGGESQGERLKGWRTSLDGALRIPQAAHRFEFSGTIVAVTLVWLLALSRWYLNDSVVPWDSKNQFYAFFRFLAESLHAGTSIFWNPYHYGGHPSIADPQSLVFSPPFLLWALFDRAPSLKSFDLIVQLHLLAGGLAMASIGYRRHWPAPASVLAATVFMLGGAASSRLNHTGIIVCYGLFPMALLTLEIAMARCSIWWAMVFTIVAGTIVLGRNQVALLLAFLLAALALREIALARSPMAYLRERMAILALIVVAGIAVTGVPVLLSLQLAALSNRPEAVLGEALLASLHPANLASMLIPDVFGAHAPNYSYWGPHYSIMPDVAATDASFNYLFLGAAPLIIFGWLGIVGGRLGDRGSRTLTWLLVLALLFTLGRYTPLFPFVFEHVPGFKFFRRPVDGTFIVTLLMAFLAGHLLSGFVQRGLPDARPLPAAVLIAAVIAIAVSTWSIAAMTDHTCAMLLAAGQVVIPAAMVVTAMLYWRQPGHRWMAAAAVTLVGVGELVAWNAASRLNAEHSKYYQLLETAIPEDAEALRLLASEIERRHAEGARPRVEIVGLGGPWQNLSVIRKIEATTGYNPLRIGIYDRYVSPSETGWLASARRFPASFNGYECALARALGLEYVVLDRPIEELKQMLRPTRLEVLMAGPKVWIYRIAGAMPRVRFSSRIRVADLDATLKGGALIQPPQQDQVSIDVETTPAAGMKLGALVNAVSTAKIASWRPGRIEVDVDAATAGVLVLHDTYYPGWIAEVDGRETPIMRAEVLFRAVEVPAGRHRIVFRFAPLTYANLKRAASDVMRKRPAVAEAGVTALIRGAELP